jgi:hydroxymethylbilane synthase
MTTIRLGSRGSALAMWQARHIAGALGRLSDAPRVEIIEIKTAGDQATDTPLWKTAGKGFFTAELDRALADGDIDLAVHSLKDLPTAMVPGLALAAVPEREDARDALICRGTFTAATLPLGATVGTSSLRRRAFIAHWRRDLVHRDLRGNVPTRLAKLADGPYDAIVLAVAGLKRLGLAAEIATALAVDTFPPAVAQGALGLVTRADDTVIREIVARLDHTPSRQAVTAERALLQHLEGGCQIPLGAIARIEGTTLTLAAQVCAVDGSQHIAAEERGLATSAASIGIAAAESLLSRGARATLASSLARAG